jgi:hypothetical protein
LGGPPVSIDGAPHRPLEVFVPHGFDHWAIWLSPRDEHDLIGRASSATRTSSVSGSSATGRGAKKCAASCV